MSILINQLTYAVQISIGKEKYIIVFSMSNNYFAENIVLYRVMVTV